MTDRPILFADAMVRAILSGEKTRSRRPAGAALAKSRPGDRLWVREALVRAGPKGDLRYRADGGAVAMALAPPDFTDTRAVIPSIHMPRWASRLLLTVEGVRHERLRDVDHREAMREGVAEWAGSEPSAADLLKRQESEVLFARLWDSLYGKTRESWARNPTVAVLQFTIEHRNIDSSNLSV